MYQHKKIHSLFRSSGLLPNGVKSVLEPEQQEVVEAEQIAEAESATL